METTDAKQYCPLSILTGTIRDCDADQDKCGWSVRGNCAFVTIAMSLEQRKGFR